MSLARLLPRFRNAYSSITTLAVRETWSRADIERYQLARLNETWSHAIAHVPYYRGLAVHQRLPKEFASLEEFKASVPTLEKTLVGDRPERFLSRETARGHWSLTSGSTGVNTRVFWEQRAHLSSLRARYRFLDAWGVDIFDRSTMLWGDRTGLLPASQRARSLIVRSVQDRLRRRLRLSANRLDRTTLRSHLRRMARFRPAVLYAYSSAAYLLAREAIESGFRCKSLRLVILTADMATPHMVETIERAFGVPAVMEYGSVECGFLAGEYPDRLLRVREDCALVETLPMPDGRYDIVVTVLGNPSFPLLRYLIGDTTDCPLLSPPRGFSVLRQISGRESDILVSRSGARIPAVSVLHIVENHPGVRRFVARQRTDGTIHLVVEIGEGRPVPDFTDIRQRLERAVGFPVELKQVIELPQTASGKHRPVVSDLA